jgi:PAS domain S-box-containing protein
MTPPFDEERLRAVLEHSLDAMALIAADGTVVYVSPAITRVLGYTPEEFVALQPFEAVHADDREAAWGRLSEIVKQPNGTQSVLNRVRHKDGSWRWVETASTNQLQNPALRAVVASFRDVTDRKRAQDAVRDAEEKFRFIVESATGFAIFTTDLAGRVDTWNSGAERILGYAEHEVLGQDCRIFFTPEDNAQDQPENEMSNAIALGQGSDERWHVRKGGARFWASGLMMPLRDDAGTIHGYLKILRDMTREKEAEQALRESEARFRSMADSAPVMIWLADTEGRLTYFNRPWLTFTGRSADENLAETWSESLHPDDRLRTTTDFGDAFDNRRPFQAEYRVRRADGEYRWFLIQATPLFAPSGTFTGYIGSGIDITDRKAAEHALKEADRRKDEFLAMLAHELRNPLAAINNAVQVSLKITHSADDLEWSKAVIERQARHLARLLDDLLDVSRITQGKIQLKKELVDLTQVITKAVEVVRPVIELKKHTLTLSLTPGQMPVLADPTRMEQVFVNLLTNAAKYTEEGGHITLTGHCDGQVIVRVRDTGVGLAPDMVPHIFELFAQVDDRIDRSQGGLGIGLTLARSLVEMHGGNLSAASDGLGKGSEFVVTLPRASEAAALQHAVPPLAEGSSGTEIRLRILVADDNVDTANGMAKLLSRSGYDITIAHDGPSALEAARATRPDVLLTDIGLPGIDGYEVARTLRQDEAFKATMFIAVSGYGQDADRLRAHEAGFDHHFVKPLDYDALLAVLKAPPKPFLPADPQPPAQS